MPIVQKGETLDSANLKATLVDCSECGRSTLVQFGKLSGESAKLLADVDLAMHRRAGKDPEVVLKGYKVGDKWPEADLKPDTQFLGNL